MVHGHSETELGQKYTVHGGEKEVAVNQRSPQ